MRLFDSHCHIASERFDEDIAEAIARFQEAGGEKALLVADPCEEEPNQEKVFALIEQYDFLYGAIGVHPHNASGWNDAAEKTVLVWCITTKQERFWLMSVHRLMTHSILLR